MNHKLDFPATGRNSDAICQVLQEHLPDGHVLEIASGSGQHVNHFARHLPNHYFWPSDLEPDHLTSIQAWTKETGLSNIGQPVLLDTTATNWHNGEPLSAILCINMIHIAPLSAVTGLFAGAAKRLDTGGLLYLYGPFLGAGIGDAPSNLAFDADLKRRNPAWGVRDLGDVKATAKAVGFDFKQSIEMPANNLSVLFRRA